LQQLIDQYEQFPCLFDTKHKLYYNKHARTDAFHKIAEVLKERVPHITVEVKKNTNLRSQDSHECAKIKKGTHSGMSEKDMYEPSAWWFSRLNFSSSHIRVMARKGQSSLDTFEV
jgi:predicted glycoside hydrolase/deacetylase ChbG (UPF0249 family)